MTRRWLARDYWIAWIKRLYPWAAERAGTALCQSYCSQSPQGYAIVLVGGAGLMALKRIIEASLCMRASKQPRVPPRLASFLPRLPLSSNLVEHTNPQHEPLKNGKTARGGLRYPPSYVHDTPPPPHKHTRKRKRDHDQNNLLKRSGPPLP